ncbi:MAG TPA: glycosyltransferase family 9 protein [bacterium]|jgi:ADP-heptose:LPS heptosyltransferase
MRIVAFLFRRIGDSLLATPALRAIKDRYPDSELSVVCEPQVARVFAHNPHIDNVVTIKRGPSALSLAGAARRHGKADFLLDFLSDPRSALATRLSGAKQRVGFVRRGMNWVYTRTVPRQEAQHPMYSAQHKLGLVTALGVRAADTATEFYLTKDDREYAATAWAERGWSAETRVAAFFVHSRRDHKRWPLDCFREVLQRMHEDRLATPLVLITPGDESAVAELRARGDLSEKHMLPVRDLGHLGGVLERCAVLVGNDGGPKHIAVALGVSTVTIFGPDSPVYWTPADTAIHATIGAEARSVRASVADVQPHAVYDAVRAMLERDRP